MRDCVTTRGGYDRVLMAVAATFLAVSATSALAQGDAPRNNAAELAIDAAIPLPEPANVPPPTASDFKLDTTATVSPGPAKTPDKTPDLAKTPEQAKAPEPTKPLDAVAAPAAEPAKTMASPPAATATAPEPAKDPVKAASNIPAADQPVADRLRDLIATKGARYFDRKTERAAVEKFYTGRDYAPIWTQAGNLTATAKGVIARLRDAAADGLNPADYPVPDFSAAAATPDALAEADLKLTESMLDYARQAQSGRMHWSQVSADIQYPEHPVDPNEVLANVTTAKDASAALESYNPPHKLYKLLKV